MNPSYFSAKIRLNRSLLEAVSRGDRRQASALLSAGATPWNCLSASITGGHRPVFAMLVKRGVAIDPGPQGPIGLEVPPVYAAILQTDDSWFFHALMELGAETNVPDRLGRTPLIFAIEHGCRHAIPTLALRDHTSIAAALSRQYRDAYADGHGQLLAPTQMVAALLEAGVKPNARRPSTVAAVQYQLPPLHAAVFADNADVALLLGNAGIDPFFEDSRRLRARDMVRSQQKRIREVITAIEAAREAGQPFDSTPFETTSFNITAADITATVPSGVPPASAVPAASPETVEGEAAEFVMPTSPQFSGAINPGSTTTLRLVR